MHNQKIAVVCKNLKTEHDILSN